MIHSVILSIGGIPLIYLGDEAGTLNDYSYRSDPAKAGDSRWVHRPHTDWGKIGRRRDPHTIEGRIYERLCRLIAVRKGCRAIADGETSVIDPGNGHVFGYIRHHAGAQMLVLANFSEREQQVAANTVRNYGVSYAFQNLVTGETITIGNDEPLVLTPYQFVWLAAA